MARLARAGHALGGGNAPYVRPNYIVTIDEHVYVRELAADERSTSGDSCLVRVNPLAVDVERHNFVEIRDRQTREVVTVLELLSPSNKRPGADREAYLAKRLEFLRSPAHLVEIDLLRGGPRLPVEGLPPCDYCAIVSRSDERPRVGIWPLRLSDPLPRIPVPLRHPDADAVLDLKSLLDRVYDAAGYEDYIYSGAPQPALTDSEARWAAELIPKRS